MFGTPRARLLLLLLLLSTLAPRPGPHCLAEQEDEPWFSDAQIAYRVALAKHHKNPPVESEKDRLDPLKARFCVGSGRPCHHSRAHVGCWARRRTGSRDDCPRFARTNEAL